MALNFPNSPTIGQQYPSPPVVGQPVYTWDGQKWTTGTVIGGAAGPLPSSATPLVEAGAGSAGSATPYSREDHVHPNGGPTPSTTPPQMNGTASPGVATPYSREDHVHPVDTSRAAVTALPAPATAIPLVESGSGAVGTSVKFAREDHTHPALGSTTRERLTANRTYYVRSDGSDSNNGLANTSGGAFLTIQKAINNLAGNVDLAGFQVNIQIGTTGTWTEAVVVQGPFVGGNASTSFVSIVGQGSSLNWTTPGGNGFPISAKYGGVIALQNLRFLNNNCHMNASYGGIIILGAGLDFGTTSGYHIYASNGGFISCSNGYTISGGALTHYQAEGASQIVAAGITVTLTGTPAFTNSFVVATRGGNMIVNSTTFSGGATGSRWSATVNGVIFCNNALPNTYFPGDTNGASATGGQIA